VTPTIDELTVADVPEVWSALGFAADGDTCVVGDVRIRLAGSDAGRGLTGWLLLDHVVAITPALERTVAALQGAGLDLRRIREEPTPARAPRQAFFRLGADILEVVQEPEEAIERGGGVDRPAFFWGLAFVAPDLDATVAGLGERVSEIRDAVQPGRRIATLRRSAGLSVPVALMTPQPDLHSA